VDRDGRALQMKFRLLINLPKVIAEVNKLLAMAELKHE
jgi:hypothetical protein